MSMLARVIDVAMTVAYYIYIRKDVKSLFMMTLTVKSLHTRTSHTHHSNDVQDERQVCVPLDLH